MPTTYDIKRPERNPVTHNLKTWPSNYADIKSGKKPFDVRRFDRDYAVGDRLMLQEWDPDGVPDVGDKPGAYTGKSQAVEITYILVGRFGVPADIAVMGIKRVKIHKTGRK